MWLVFRYALAAVRAVARERRELALENIALRHHIEVLTRNRRRPATATGRPAAVVITLPHVAELASPHRDRAARHRGALASDGVASLLEMEESGRQTWSPSHRARPR